MSLSFQKKKNIYIYSWISFPSSLGSFLSGSNGKEFACNAGDLGLIPGSGRSPGVGNDNPLHYYCLKNSMYREAWQATVHRVAKSHT